MSKSVMTTKQKIINLISLVLLVLVFWNFLKPKPAPQTAVVEDKPAGSLTPFEKGLDCKCDQNFVVTPSLKVIKKLKDDTKGIRHQKWLLQNSNGQIILFVHNLELCKPLDIEKNETVQLAGEFKWTEKGALVHWAHYDPKKKRPDGYVEYNGQKHCARVGSPN